MAAQVLDLSAHRISRGNPGSECERLADLLAELEWGDRVLWSHLQELERQFIEGDLCVLSGPRKGRPLTPAGRRNRLQRLLDANREWHANVERIRSIDAAQRRATASRSEAQGAKP